MKTFCLREVYGTSNLGFSTEVTLFEGSESAYLIKTQTLPMLSCEATGTAEDGRKPVQAECINRTFEGKPLLLELVATEDEASGLAPLAIRRVLEDRIGELLGLLTWSLPGVIGPKLGNALFSRTEKHKPREWDWDDCQPFTVPRFVAEPKAAKEICTANRQCLTNHKQHKENIIRAMRWWRVGVEAVTQVDRFIAFWIAIEACSKIYDGDNAKQARTLIANAFLKLDLTRVRSISKRLHGARGKAAHSGERNLRNIDALTQLAGCIAKAAIQYLFTEQTSETPDTLLEQLGI